MVYNIVINSIYTIYTKNKNKLKIKIKKLRKVFKEVLQLSNYKKERLKKIKS